MIVWPLNPLPRLIERARPEDMVQLEEIHAASFPQRWSADELAALNTHDGVLTLVARRASLWASSRPVGFIIVRRAADEGEILTVCVHPRYRRGGTGYELVAAALRHLYTERVARVFLEVSPDNAGAIALYRRFGFTEVGNRANYYDERPEGARHAVILRLDLY
jgi:ribosomal-protein-alanine N-acetyltransferase